MDLSYCFIKLIHLLPAIGCAQRQQNPNSACNGRAAPNGGVTASGAAATVGRGWGLGGGEVNRY
jgi:hypothetical protein